MATPSKRPSIRGFAADAPTERALRAGLAGRDIQIQRGRLPAALRALAAEPSSSLVFVDLDGVSEPEAAARQLTGICAFETSVVAIGSTDTAQYGRALLQHGISDYLVKPVTSAAIREAASTLTDGVSEHLYAGKVVAFAGSAGSGRSTLVAALARSRAGSRKTGARRPWSTWIPSAGDCPPCWIPSPGTGWPLSSPLPATIRSRRSIRAG